jgi:hypothetical protein
MLYIANNFDVKEETAQLTAFFNQIDKDRNHTINRAELWKGP